MGFKSDGGSSWADIVAASTTIKYPSNGIGASTISTTANSFTSVGGTSNASNVVIDGVLLTAQAAATTLVIYAIDGATVIHTLSIALNQPCPFYIPLGGPNGLAVGAGFAYNTGAATLLGEIYFRVIR